MYVRFAPATTGSGASVADTVRTGAEVTVVVMATPLAGAVSTESMLKVLLVITVPLASGVLTRTTSWTEPEAPAASEPIDRRGLRAGDAVGLVVDHSAVGERAGDADDELDGARGAGGERADRPGDDGAGEGTAAGGDERGVRWDGVGQEDSRRVGVAGVGIGQGVCQVRSRGHRVGRIGGDDGQNRGGHHGGGDSRSGDRLALVADNRVGGIGDRCAVGQRAGDTDDGLE